jgi:hypothetical protein
MSRSYRQNVSIHAIYLVKFRLLVCSRLFTIIHPIGFRMVSIKYYQCMEPFSNKTRYRTMKFYTLNPSLLNLQLFCQGSSFFCFLSAFFVSYKSSFGPTSLSIARTKRLFLNVPHVFVVLFIIVKMFQCFPSAQRFEFMTSHKIFYAIRSGFGILTQHPSYRLLNKKFVAARSS